MAEPEDVVPAAADGADIRLIGGRVGTPMALGAGLAAGLTAGLFGVGGGVLLVPVLALVLKRTQHVAHATSLVAVTMAAAAGVARFAMDDAVALSSALALASGSIIGARLGSRLLPRISEGRLRRGFGVVVLLLAVRFILVGGATGAGATDGSHVPDLGALVLALHAGGGLLAGITSSVLGVGGGVIMVPLMALGFGYGQHIAEGTSLAVIVPTALTGAVGHARNGYTDWKLGLRLGAAALVGSALGASIALGVEPTSLGRAYGILQALLAIPMLRPIVEHPPGDVEID